MNQEIFEKAGEHILGLSKFVIDANRRVSAMEDNIKESHEMISEAVSFIDEMLDADIPWNKGEIEIVKGWLENSASIMTASFTANLNDSEVNIDPDEFVDPLYSHIPETEK
jgi:hypothetical protein